MKEAPSRLYDDIFAFGATTPTSAGHIEAEIGGMWAQPDLALSYLLAARHVITTGSATKINEVSLPAAFLQRHALELIFKDLLHSLYRLQRDIAWAIAIQEHRLKAYDSEKMPEPTKVKETHSLTELCDALEAALSSGINELVPADIRALVENFTEAERVRTDDEAAKALEERKTRRGKTRKPVTLAVERYRYLSGDEVGYFRTVERINLGERQERLEAVFAKHLIYDKSDDPQHEDNLVTSIANEQNAADQHLQSIAPWLD